MHAFDKTQLIKRTFIVQPTVYSIKYALFYFKSGRVAFSYFQDFK